MLGIAIVGAVTAVEARTNVLSRVRTRRVPNNDTKIG
jgi:hypothetical protein